MRARQSLAAAVAIHSHCWASPGERGSSTISRKTDCGSLRRRLDPAHLLDAGSMFLGFDAALARRLGRLGGPAHTRGNCSATDEINQALERILAVAALHAMTLRN